MIKVYKNDYVDRYNYDKDSDNSIKCYGKKNESEQNNYFKIDDTKINEHSINLFKENEFRDFIKNPNYFNHTTKTLSNANYYSAKDCQDEALKHLSKFFLVNDIKKDQGSNKVTYQCIIPKNDIVYKPTQQQNIGKDIFKHFVGPTTSFIDNVFSKNNKNLGGDEIVNNKNQISSATKKCIEYKDTDFNKSNFPENKRKEADSFNKRLNRFGIDKDHFVLYQTDIAKTYKNYSLKNTYDKYLDFSDNNLATLDANKNAKLNEIRLLLKTYKSDFINANSNNTAIPQVATNKNIVGIADKIKELYNLYFKDEGEKKSLATTLNDITSDISYVSNLHSNYLDFINYYEKEIVNQQRIYKNLKTSKNGNNAKLHDSNYIKKLNLTEIILLFFISALVVFMSVKKNKIKIKIK